MMYNKCLIIDESNKNPVIQILFILKEHLYNNLEIDISEI